MTGLEIFLLIAGIIIMVVSFLFGEQLDAKSGADNAGLDEDAIKSMVKSSVENAVEETIDETVEKTAIELDKLSNEKIMTVSDYSESVLNEIAKNHEEVMFLYSMLNDKEEQIKDTVKDVEMLKASVKNMVRKAHQAAKKPEKKPVEQSVSKQEEKKETEVQPSEQVSEEPQPESKIQPDESEVLQTKEIEPENTADILEEQMNNNQKILSLYQSGMSNIDIAKELNLGLGEVRLVIDLYKTRGKG